MGHSLAGLHGGPPLVQHRRRGRCLEWALDPPPPVPTPCRGQPFTHHTTGLQKEALKWLQRLTLLLQNAQRALYGVRHTELLSERRAATAATVISHRRQCIQSRTRTLYQAWKLK
jgi:hypothetical protein